MKYFLLLFVIAAFVASSLAQKNEICGLSCCQTGFGLAFIPSWTFTGSDCVQFYYAGGFGNGNRFDSQAECEETCME